MTTNIGLVIYDEDGKEYYNSFTEHKLIFQEEITLTGWIQESSRKSYYVDVSWIDPSIHVLGNSKLTVTTGRVYMLSLGGTLSNVSSSTSITTSVFRII